MPLIEVVAADGHYYPCASSDPELLARWLWETVGRMAPPPRYAHTCALTVRVFPLTLPDGSADWPREARTTLFPTEGQDSTRALMQPLIEWLQARARSDTP